jgi:hypothetical protein
LVLKKKKLLDVLREHKEAIGWTIEDIQGISPLVVMHKIHLEEDAKPSREPQRRLNPAMQEVVRAEVIKLLDAGIIYPISDSKWVSPIHVVPKRAGLTVVENKDGELVPNRVQSGWRVCIDYRKLNAATRNAWRGMLITVSWMDILDTTRYLWTPKIRRGRLSPALLAHSPIVACLLGYAMHPLLFSGAWSASSTIW